MILQPLTLVIPTRDRPDFLEKCLRSVFSCQAEIPSVIVSDNSITDHSAIATLRRQYGFAYIRQSGKLSQTEHLNICCKELPSTPWVLVLHDDDELYPDSLRKLNTFLSQCENVGLVVAGIQYIDEQGTVRKEWIPKCHTTLRGEEALRYLGLEWRLRPPGMILSVQAVRKIGGYVEIGRTAADYVLATQLGYVSGVAFFPKFVGRFRQGIQQMTDVSTPEKSAEWLEFSIRQAELTAALGCSAATADQVMDYSTWWTFLGIASRWFPSQPSFVTQLARRSLHHSPRTGQWQRRVRREYPFLFWRPSWLAWKLCQFTQRARRFLEKL